MTTVKKMTSPWKCMGSLIMNNFYVLTVTFTNNENEEFEDASVAVSAQGEDESKDKESDGNDTSEFQPEVTSRDTRKCIACFLTAIF
jgi:hypothetical protein